MVNNINLANSEIVINKIQSFSEQGEQFITYTLWMVEFAINK